MKRKDGIVRNRNRLGSGWCVALVVWFLAGCAVFKSYESPRVTIVSVEISEISLFETVFNVQLRIVNPNDTDLSLQAAECRLTLNGKDMLQGVSQSEALVPAYGSVKVPVTLYSNVIEMVRGLLRLRGRENLAYELAGKLRMKAAGIPATLPFSSRGELSLADGPMKWLERQAAP